jgi:1-acyl-sn-glycerol-3-phosphate acyltransferase
MLARILATLYGCYAAAAFVVVVFVLFCPVLIVAPTLRLRREIGRACVRAWLAASFIPFRVRGREHLPAGPCVVVCNHASYLDGILLTAALPARFTFLVQHGAADWLYIGLIVRRMGVHFVNRQAPRAAARATRALIERLDAGESLAIFPEGTFRAAPELLPFRSGAFLVAAHAGVPVVPVALRGTRRLFGEGQRLFRHSRVEVEILPALRADGAHREAVERLLESSRAAILARCGESDGAAGAQ